MNYSILCLVTFIWSALADFSFTMPVAGTTWKSGDPVTISWVTSDTKQTLHFSLVNGDPNDLQPVIDLGSAPIEARTLVVTLPGDLISGDDYSVKGEAASDVNYSHPFKIIGDKPSGSKPSSKPTSISESTSTSTSASTSTSGSSRSRSASPNKSGSSSDASQSEISFLLFASFIMHSVLFG